MSETTITRNKIIFIKDSSSAWNKMKKDRYVYLMLLPAIVFTFIFSYLPLRGIIIAFMDFNVYDMFSSPWTGLTNFEELFKTPEFLTAVGNTLLSSSLSLIIGFPIPIIFALLVNELKGGIFKRFVQTVSYMPNFLSWIAVIGIVQAVYSIYGPINDILSVFGKERILFLSLQGLFLPNIILLGIWKSFGFSSILYLAALTSIDPQLYEAARIDGANKLRQAIHITLPGIKPTVVMMLIMSMGYLVGDNFELVYGLSNAYINYPVISTVVYNTGLRQGNYSMAAAFGLSQNIVGCILVLGTNKLSKMFNQGSIQ